MDFLYIMNLSCLRNSAYVKEDKKILKTPLIKYSSKYMFRADISSKISKCRLKNIYHLAWYYCSIWFMVPKQYQQKNKYNVTTVNHT